MVLTDRDFTGRDLTEVGRGESAGQVLILIAVVVGLVVISSALVLNVGMQTTVDTADGASTTTPEAATLIDDINADIQQTLVVSNRDPAVDITDGDLVAPQQERYTEVTDYQHQQVDVTVDEYIDGTRLATDTEAELTNASSDSWTVLDDPEEITGGIELNASTISNAEGPLHIETTTHDIHVTAGDEHAVEATVEAGGESTTYRSNQSHPYVDLGEGSVAGYRFDGYNQREIDSVRVHNGTAANGTIEFVVTEYNSVDESLTETDATFGVVYTVTAATERQTTTRQDVATHGPLRGEF